MPLIQHEYIPEINDFQTSYPVHIYSLARKLGIQVLPSDRLPDNISGIIEPDEDVPGSYIISVNASHPNHRRRFTIAHQIAHFILHKKLIVNGITDDAQFRSSLPYRHEVEANKLAMDLLMPWHLLNPLLDDEYIVIGKLADLFDVSTAVIAARLRIPVECRIG